MSLQIQLKKSAVSQKQPFASDLAVGELALNYNADGPFLTCKDSDGNVRKLNHVWVGATAPTSPSAGDQWLDTSAATAVLKVYKDSSSTWVNATTIPIATTSVYGTVQLATAADVTNGTSGKIVDAAQLQSKITSAFAQEEITLNDVNLLGDMVIAGDLTVNGTTTTIDTETLIVEDKNIEMGSVDTPTDTTADGGGITLKGTTDKTLNWVDATDSWTSSENVDLASGKSYRINGTEVLSATALGSAVQISSANIPNGTIVDSDINAAAEIAVSKLADGTARQLLQTDAAGTGVEWTSNVDVPGTLDVTGAATFDSTAAHPLGTAAAPTITFTGDPNTGIYSPGADQLAISTNGTGRLFVDANGNVGIGAAPDTAFALDATAGNGTIRAQAGGFYVAETYSTANNIYRIYDNSGEFAIESQIFGNTTATSSPIVFRTSNSGGRNERMRITADGRLGIGTSSPSGLLHISTSGDAIVDLQSSGASSFAGVNYSNGDRSWYAGIRADASDGWGIRDITGSATRLLIDTSGRLGLGTSSPQGKLHVTGSGESTGAVLVLENGGNISSLNDPVGVINFRVNDASITAGTFGSIGCYNAYNGNWDGNPVKNSTYLAFSTSNANTTAERVRIDSSGRLLVGTSSARANFNNSTETARIQVEGGTVDTASCSAVRYTNGAGAGGAIRLGRTRGTAANQNTLVASGDGLGIIEFSGADGTELVVGASIAASADGTPGANDMPGRLVFSTTADGASSPTERMRITSDAYVRLASGTGGIQFNGDTAAANALDDYEEGTWTPTVFGATTAGTYTVTAAGATYTKIGNIVNVQARISFSAASGGAGNLQIGGLPFTYAANQVIASPPILNSVDFGSADYVVVAHTGGGAATTLGMTRMFDTTSSSPLSITAITASSSFQLNITYRV